MKLAISLIFVCGVVATLLPLRSDTLQEERPGVFCEEIAHELNRWFQDGQISRPEADRIIERCYDLYGDM